ncbi:ATP-binding protein [Myceligenerans cantabricum]
MRPRIHTAPFVTRPDDGWRARRQRRRAAHDAALHAREGTDSLAHGRPDSGETTSSPARYLPRSGERGPATLRTSIRFRLPKHQDTSAVWQGAYPFLAEGGLGTDGLFIGRDLYSGSSFVYDPWVLYQRGLITAPNVVVAGIVGAGKSALAKSLYVRSLPFGRRVYIPCDPKGEHTAVARAVGGTVIALGPGMPARLNPLDEGHRPATVTDAEWAAQVTARRRSLLGALAETMLERHLSAVEHTCIDTALTTATNTAGGTPVLPAVVDRLLEPDPAADSGVGARLTEDGRHVGHALRRLVHGDLAGMFDAHSTVAFDASAPMLSLDLSRVAENATAMSVLMTCCSAWMEAALADPDGGQRWVVHDEAWRLMAQPALLRRMDAHWRLARHYGIANMLIFHKVTDLDNVGDAGSANRALATSLLANAETRIIYRQETDQLSPTATALGLTGTERALLPGLGVGQGLWHIRNRAFVVQHQMAPIEAELFDSRQRML